uniref:Polypyrimidine tract-binding protein 3 n=1 Tax=Aceria tosichella TaxID=561515 RepID=A0A6G1SBV0_9ACAR
MTSPGLKRPLDLELIDQTTTATANETTSEPTGTDGDVGVNNNGPSGTSPELDDGTNANGTKRRCTDSNLHTKLAIKPDPNRPESSDVPMPPDQEQQQQQSMVSASPPSRDPLTVSLDDDINDLIQAELHNSSSSSSGSSVGQRQTDSHDQLPSEDEQLILTVRQLRSICVKLVNEREKKLRQEFDRRLASKLAEQYDLFAKANYLNTFSEPTRIPTPVSTTAPASTTASAANNMAVALMQGTNTNSILSPDSLRNPVPSAAASMPNLTTIAANGHHNAIPSTHHLAAYNLQQHQAAAAATAMRFAHHQQHQQQRISMPIVSANNLIPFGPVLLASNLDEQLATPEALFTLFGVFGDVIRVKILFNKKDNALIQMADSSRAQVAQSYLDKQRIFGKVIRVTRSKHHLVQMPRDGGQSDAGLTKDFTNSPLHRFKIPGSRNYLNIYPPSNTLHVSNIPATVDEKDLHKVFKGQCGFEFTSFKFFPKDRKMALMRFNSVEHASIALIRMHNYQISDENNLRVSFSKSAL